MFGMHLYADILVRRSIVKIKLEDDEEDGSGEPLHKKMRIGSTEDNEGSDSDESSDSDSIVEVKKELTGSHAISQGLAQTIVNGFCEVKKNPSLSRSFVLSFVATGQNLRIFMHNCGKDRLIMTNDLDLFFSESSRSVPILDFKTILSVRYTLKFDIFDKMEPESESSLEFLQFYNKLNFKEQAGLKYSTYKENCTKPKKGKVTEKHINVDFLVSSIIHAIKEMVTHNKEVKSVLSHKT